MAVVRSPGGEDLLFPIPEQVEQDGWKEVPIEESGDPLVPIGPFSDYPTLFTNATYFGERTDSPYQLDEGNQLAGALITVFVRESVANRLLQAQALLPAGHRLVVFDAYRSLDVQQALYDHYLESLSRSRPELGDDELSTETQKYVSVPSTVSSRPSPHNTGGSVDLAVLRLSPRDEAKVQEIDRELAALPYETDWSLFLRRVEDPYAEPDESSQRAYVLEMERMLTLRDGGELLDFGTPFDHGGPEAALRHYETTSLGPQDVPARDNRRLLHNALAAAGFAGFPSEWWHVNAPETQMGAKVLGLPKARFGGLELDASHRDFENMRRGHHAGMIFQFERLANGKPHIPAGLPELTWAYLLNLQALESMHRRGAPPTRSGLPQAAVIAAPGDVGRRSTGATSRSPNRKNSRRPGPR